MTTKLAHAADPPVKPEKVPPQPASLPLPPLPTFDWEVGYREIYDPETGQSEQLPLTLLDILYPTEEDIGVVVVTQSLLHDLWTNWLKVMLQTYLGQGWLVLNDVLVHWGRKGAPAKGPDVAAIPGAGFAAHRKSYRVGLDGPLPTFVLEITSEDTRETDLHEKRLLYAAVGVKEYLIIDLLPKSGQDWQLLGYRLEDSPYYQELPLDAEGGLTFETVGLRFVAVGQERIDVYETATGQRLLRPDELQEYAEAEATRAEAEAKARAEAEARVVQLEARLRQLEAGTQTQPAEDPPSETQ